MPNDAKRPLKYACTVRQYMPEVDDWSEPAFIMTVAVQYMYLLVLLHTP